MIEFELKLQVNEFPEINEKFFVKEKRVFDVYYDTEKYDLLIGGNFLRVRNEDKIDFKLNIGDDSHSYCKETSFLVKNYTENKNVKQIFKSLGLNYNHNYKNFEEFLKVNNLVKLAVVDKKRKTYKIDDIEISLDDTKDIGKFIEIEKDFFDDYVIEKDKIRKEILQQFEKVVKLKDFKFVDIGYVELYLKKHNQNAYNLGKFKD